MHTFTMVGLEGLPTQEQLTDPKWAAARLGKTSVGHLGRPEEGANVAHRCRDRRRWRPEGLVIHVQG